MTKEASEVLTMALQKAGGWSNGPVLPEEGALLLLQVEVSGSSNHLFQAAEDGPGMKQGSLNRDQPHGPHQSPTVAASRCHSQVNDSISSIAAQGLLFC